MTQPVVHPHYALEDLPWSEVAGRVATERRLIVPIGVCDQYGPHLPLGAGTRVVEALANDLAREFGVLRAPVFPFGVNVPAEADYAGTASLRAKTLHRALNEVAAAWSAHGFNEFIAITASPHEPHVEAIATIRAVHARVRVVDALSVDLSQFLEGERGPEHGGEALTSILLHLQPERVRMEAARDFLMGADEFRRFTRGQLKRLPAGCPGSVGQPTRATAEKGRLMYEHILQKIRHKVFIAPPREEEE
jgi:creatinine amidohydrolase